MNNSEVSQLELFHKKEFITLCVDAHIDLLKVMMNKVAQKTMTPTEFNILNRAVDILDHYSKRNV